MTQNLILQPSEPTHFRDTIERPVPLEVLRPFLAESDIQELTRRHADDPIRVWGITPGVSDANVSQWKRVREGDLAAFTSNRRVIY